MTIKQLIKILSDYPEDASIAIKEKVLDNRDGYSMKTWEWVPLEEKHIFKPSIGDRIYIGNK